jgi:hypothetical protein
MPGADPPFTRVKRSLEGAPLATWKRPEARPSLIGGIDVEHHRTGWNRVGGLIHRYPLTLTYLVLMLVVLVVLTVIA